MLQQSINGSYKKYVCARPIKALYEEASARPTQDFYTRIGYLQDMLFFAPKYITLHIYKWLLLHGNYKIFQIIVDLIDRKKQLKSLIKVIFKYSLQIIKRRKKWLEKDKNNFTYFIFFLFLF